MAEAERPKDDLPPDPFGRVEQITVTCSRSGEGGAWEVDVDHEGISPWAARSLLREAIGMLNEAIEDCRAPDEALEAFDDEGEDEDEEADGE